MNCLAAEDGGSASHDSGVLTSSPTAVTLLEFGPLLAVLHLVVFEVTSRLLRQAVSADGARRDVELPAASPCGLLNTYNRVSGT